MAKATGHFFDQAGGFAQDALYLGGASATETSSQ